MGCSVVKSYPEKKKPNILGFHKPYMTNYNCILDSRHVAKHISHGIYFRRDHRNFRKVYILPDFRFLAREGKLKSR